MRKIHNLLLQKSEKYSSWHQIKMANSVHLLIFVAVAILTTLFLINQVQILSEDKSASVFDGAGEQLSTARWKDHNTLLREGRIQNPETVLEVGLTYDETTQPIIVIKSLENKKAYIPAEKKIKGDYLVQLVDEKGRALGQKSFDIPNIVSYPPPQTENEIEPEPVVLRTVDFSVVLPYNPKAVRVNILSAKGRTLISFKDLSLIGPTIDTLPKYRSIRGDEFISGGEATSFLPKITKTALADTNPGYLDIVFIGDRYSADTLGVFHNDVVRFTSALLRYEPFKSRASQIVFHYVDNTTSLGCKYSGRLLTCSNYSLITNLLNNAKVPYDEVVVIVNSSTYGGSGGINAIAYNGSSGPEVFVHEFGHSFGNLIDEYLLYNTNGPIYKRAVNNCLSGTAPASEWSGLVASGSYFLGCNYKNWYRSTSNSLMKDLSYKYFNAVSQKLINDRLDVVAGVFQGPVAPDPIPDPIPVPETVSIILDNEDSVGVKIEGTWIPSTTASGYQKSNYLHDGNISKGNNSITYTPNLEQGGSYKVYINYTSASNRATNVPVDIQTSTTLETVTVNQTTSGVWKLLGTYNFDSGNSGFVKIRTTGTTNYVIADAVKWVKVSN